MLTQARAAHDVPWRRICVQRGSTSLSDASQVRTCRVDSASGSAAAERVEADSLRVHSSSG